MAPMFSGGVEGHEDIGDATYIGGMPEIIKRTGYDYLDFDQFPSGYPGDLFGYSIDMHKNRLIVGAPTLVRLCITTSRRKNTSPSKNVRGVFGIRIIHALLFTI